MVALGSFFHFVWSDSTLSCKRIESTHHGLSNAVLKNVVRLLVIFIKFDEFWSRFVENHKKDVFRDFVRNRGISNRHNFLTKGVR